MNKKVAISISVMIILLLAFVLKVKAQVNQPYHFINNPYQGNPARLSGTMLTSSILWTAPDVKTAWCVYQLNQGDRIIVDYQDVTGKYYLVKYYFDAYHQPIIGWTYRNNILLDEDIVPTP